MVRINILLLLFVFSCINAFTIEQKDFYKAFSGSSLTNVNTILEELEKEKNTNKRNAYLGALLMKKADLVKPVLKKLNLFKEGYELLEQEINENPGNVEYRFLRFVIQENAPLILNYRKNIEEDKKVIRDNFNKMEKGLKLVIIDYLKFSQRLSIEELN